MLSNYLGDSELQNSKEFTQNTQDAITAFIAVFGKYSENSLLAEMANFKKEMKEAKKRNDFTLYQDAKQRAEKKAKELGAQTTAMVILIEAYGKFRDVVVKLRINEFFSENNKGEFKPDQDEKAFLKERGNYLLKEMEEAFDSFITQLKQASRFDHDGVSLAQKVFEGFTAAITNQQNNEALRNTLYTNIQKLNHHFNGMDPVLKPTLALAAICLLMFGSVLTFLGAIVSLAPNPLLVVGIPMLAVGSSLLALAGGIIAILGRDCKVRVKPGTEKMLDFLKMISPDTQKPKSSPLSCLGSFSGSKKKQEAKREEVVGANTNAAKLAPAGSGS